MWHLRIFLYPLLIFSLGLSLSANGAQVDPLPRQIQQTFGQGQLEAAFWLPDGRLLAQTSQGPRLYDLWFRELGAPAAWGPQVDWISQTGSYFLTQGPQGLAWWDWPAGAAEPTRLGQAEGGYQGGTLRPDGAALALFRGHEVFILSGDSPSPSLLGVHGAAVASLAWNAAGDLFASADSRGEIILWEAGTFRERARLQHLPPEAFGGVGALAWWGDMLASGGDDGHLRLWSDTGEAQGDLGGHPGPIRALSWHPGGEGLASAGGFNFRGSQIRLWDTASGQTSHLMNNPAAFLQVAWNPSGTALLALSEDQLLRLWDAGGRAINTLQGYMAGVEGLDWRPDGAELASAHDDGLLRIWNPATGEVLASLQGHVAGINSVDWSPDGHLLASGGWDNQVRVWVRATGKTRSLLLGHQERVWMVKWHPGGRFLASASRDQTVRIWNAFTGEVIHILRGPQSDVNAIAWSGDGTRLAGASDDGSVWVWDAATGEALHQLSGHNRYVFTLAWRPGTDEILSGSWFDGTMRLWDAQSGRRLENFNSSRVAVVEWNPSGRLFVTADHEGMLRLWDAEEGTVVRVLKPTLGETYALAWHPGGEVFASGGADGLIRIWGE